MDEYELVLEKLRKRRHKLMKYPFDWKAALEMLKEALEKEPKVEKITYAEYRHKVREMLRNGKILTLGRFINSEGGVYVVEVITVWGERIIYEIALRTDDFLTDIISDLEYICQGLGYEKSMSAGVALWDLLKGLGWLRWVFAHIVIPRNPMEVAHLLLLIRLMRRAFREFLDKLERDVWLSVGERVLLIKDKEILEQEKKEIIKEIKRLIELYELPEYWLEEVEKSGGGVV